MPFHWFSLPCWIPFLSAPDTPHWHLMGDCNCADGKIRTELFLHSQRPWIKHFRFAWCPFMFCMRLTRGLGNCTAWTRIDCGFIIWCFFCLTSPDLCENYSLLAGSTEVIFLSWRTISWPVKVHHFAHLKGAFSVWPLTLPKRISPREGVCWPPTRSGSHAVIKYTTNIGQLSYNTKLLLSGRNLVSPYFFILFFFSWITFGHPLYLSVDFANI